MASVARLRVALAVGAAIWLALLLVGFVAPGGWRWGLPGPVGHMENYMIGLWFVTLVLAPLLACRDPLGQSAAVQVFILGMAAVVLSSIRNQPLSAINDGVPWAAAALSIGLLLWAHPAPQQLWRGS
ncbi:MAG TPA: hypothetical protein VFE37_29490 [Chloroflexota bacterium]|nr:hypothetical protein [Chloroflexota bacterium]